MPKLSLDRILQSQGIGSRTECRALIAQGDISVDGKPIRDWKTQFETNGFAFVLRGEPWLFREKVYLALNKPAGYECSRDPKGHPSVLSLLPPHLDRRGVQPVGRLDQNTTGLILLSDDGPFIHAQASPKRHVPKTYRALTADPISDDQLGALRSGVLLRDEELPLAAITCERIGDRELEIVIDQGKYHQVKRMIAAAGNRCVRLHRIAVGRLILESLKLEEGSWRYLESAELAALTETMGR
ncbi:MAG: pseudouridine synthase [Treponemataceae bacterium]